MSELDHDWIVASAARIAEAAERELEALVAVSSPSGDAEAAERIVAVTVAMLPTEAEVERIECSSAGHAPDLLATVRGEGSGRVVLLGHLDTVVSHEAHRPLEHDDGRLVGSGSIDMKGGIALALGVVRELTPHRDAYAELCLLAVNDEEWRTGGFAHGPRFADFDACLCFEAGQRGPNDEDAIIVKRKAAGTLRIVGRGVAAHAGANPERGRNALLALAEASRRVAALNDPEGPERLTANPTVVRAGEAFNVIPDHGELTCDLRADRLEAFEPVLESVGSEIDGVELDAALVRRWPGMDTRELALERLLPGASGLLGRPIHPGGRGGASDASHVAEHVALTVDGLGPRGGLAHNPGEFLSLESLRPRAAVALAITVAALRA